jgi:hypothetical protein
MRSLNEIVIAVQDCEPCTDEELRMCVMALHFRNHNATRDMDELCELVKCDDAKAKFRAAFWTRENESRFRGNKMPVDEFLGPGNIPWNDEYKARMKMAKNVFKKATGIDL